MLAGLTGLLLLSLSLTSLSPRPQEDCRDCLVLSQNTVSKLLGTENTVSVTDCQDLIIINSIFW